MKNYSACRLTALTVFFLFLSTMTSSAAPLEPQKIPEPLKPWSDWVLYGLEEELVCAPLYNNAGQLQCDWPTSLRLVLGATAGSFEQQWLMQHENWVALPGNDKHWPEAVTVDGQTAVVLSRDGIPSVHLSVGRHTLRGSFSWLNLPEFLQIPRHTALVSLSLNNTDILFPNIDDNGQLWLQNKQPRQEKIENRLGLKVFRRLSDQIPPLVAVHIEMDVAGSAREIMLGQVLAPAEFIPLSLESSLPARLEKDGRLRVQTRPGQWRITVQARHLGPLQTMTFSKPEGPWAEEEIWVFEARNNLRLVEIEGVTAIDPQQTTLPDSWRNLPAYRLLPGETMHFTEKKRGDPEPAPDQLTLAKNIWLRFDGQGYTMQDTISGSKNTGWRLEMNAPVKLGRVAIDGVEQFITHKKDSDKAGVELRRGLLQLVADSELPGDISHLPATGWDHTFQKVSARLHLPPGWRLINATGVDAIQTTWLKRWTLLDLFLVLIITLAVARLYSRPFAFLALLTLVLIYHEPEAPRWVWPNLLIGITLLRLVPAGSFNKIIRVYLGATVLVLFVISLPFMVRQMRVGIFPQLEKSWMEMDQENAFSKAAAPELQAPPAPVADVSEKEEDMILEGRTAPPPEIFMAKTGRQAYFARPEIAQYDPNVMNQTGPGLPSWQWTTVSMDWSGPVAADQNISLLLIGPKTNLLLASLRVILLALFSLGLLGIKYSKGHGLKCSKVCAVWLLPLLLFASIPATPARAAEIPSPEMFAELRDRLLEKADCFPNCADISTLTITVTPASMNLSLTVDTFLDIAIPLPGAANHWQPREVSLDGKAAEGLFHTGNGNLWLLTPKGKHTVSLSGPLPPANTLQLPLPLKPHRVTVNASGWSVEGVHEDGKADNQIQLKRVTETEQALFNEILESGILPAFALVERDIILGLNWRVQTRIERTSPLGAAIVLAVPLLPGESVTTEGVRVENGKAMINLDAMARQVSWESSLDKQESLVLHHEKTDLWTEVWKVNVSPIWHLEYSGIPVILHQEGLQWSPTWHPWPEEEVTLTITRPAGIPGQTITLDREQLEIRPGQRATDSRLLLELRSSQGGQHSLVLPQEAQLQKVAINDLVQPIRQEGRTVTLPIVPGKQKIELQWREASGISNRYVSPLIDLNLNSVNAHVDLYMPQNRWTLYLGGPQMGPAVLFWSVIVIIVLAAFGLSRTGLTPLRFHQWLLLGIGMSQASVFSVLWVVGWLLALDFRKRLKTEMKPSLFDLMQIGLAGLTVAAIVSLIFAISTGLLGQPDMQITGNGSSSFLLRWYQDYSLKQLPRVWVFSIPMFYYRLAMLAWALWISFTLLRLLKWGWGCFNHQGLWRKIPKRFVVDAKAGKKSEPLPLD